MLPLSVTLPTAALSKLKIYRGWGNSRTAAKSIIFHPHTLCLRVTSRNNLNDDLKSVLFIGVEAKMEGNSSLRGLGIFGKEDAFSLLKICLDKIHQVLKERTSLDNVLLVYSHGLLT